MNKISMVSGEISDWMHKSGEAARSAARLGGKGQHGAKKCGIGSYGAADS